MELVPPPGKYLVGIGLVANVPNEAVMRRIEHIMHSHREFDCAETCTCMAADTGAGIDNELADLVGNLLKVLNPQPPQIRRGVDLG
jgi:hypothetical protein